MRVRRNLQIPATFLEENLQKHEKTLAIRMETVL